MVSFLSNYFKFAAVCVERGRKSLLGGLQAWPTEEGNTKDEEAALSGKIKGRRQRQPRDELSDDVRYYLFLLFGMVLQAFEKLFAWLWCQWRVAQS